MAKENPYFKFSSSEWLNGAITLESFEIQGLFINICAYYWHKSGSLSITETNKRFKNPVGLDLLLKENLIGLDKDALIISFLDEQLLERGIRVRVNTANGKLGGRPKKTDSVPEQKPTVNPELTNKEKRRVREEKKREELEKSKKEFAAQISAFKERYTREILTEFYKYWIELNKSKTKMRFQGEEYFDLERRLSTWASKEKGNYKPQEKEFNPFT